MHFDWLEITKGPKKLMRLLHGQKQMKVDFPSNWFLFLFKITDITIL